jgi:hypothetical protein
MKCASRIVGALGVAVFLLAIIVRYQVGESIHLLGIKTCSSHLVLGANTLILIALLLRTQEPCEKK